MFVLPSVELYGGAMKQFDDLEFIQAMSQVIRRMCGCGDMKSSQAPIQDFTAGLRGGFAAVDHRRQFAAVRAGGNVLSNARLFMSRKWNHNGDSELQSVNLFPLFSTANFPLVVRERESERD